MPLVCIKQGCLAAVLTVERPYCQLTIAYKDNEDATICAFHLQPVDAVGQICTTRSTDEPLQVPPQL